MADATTAPTLFTAATEASREAGPAAIAPHATLVRLAVAPRALSRATALFALLAAEHGLSAEETESATLVVEGGTLYLAADLDVQTTRTVDGRRRPQRLRYQVEAVLLEAHPEVRWVGARVPLAGLLRALRNKTENSENYSVLDERTVLSVEADGLGRAPARVLITPESTPDRPRVVELGDPVDAATVTDLRPARAARRLGSLDADTLTDLAGVADESVGVLVHPGSAGTSPYVAGVGPRGMVVSRYEPTDPELFDPSQGPMVLSGRLAGTLGILQEPMADLSRTHTVARVAEQTARLQAAALAAALDEPAESEALVGALHAQVGAEAARQFLAEPGAGSGAGGGAGARGRGATRTAEAPSVLEPALRFARALVQRGDARALVEGLAAGAAVAPAAALEGIVLAETGGDVLVARAALAYLAWGSRTEDRERALSVLLGEAEVRAAAAAVVPESQREGLRRSDLALGAVRAAGRRAGEVVEAVVSRVEPDGIPALWERLDGYARQLHVHEGVLSDLAARRLRKPGTRPTASGLTVPRALAAEWQTAARHDVEGRFWVEPDGRVTAGWDQGADGQFSVSDLAVQPDPAHYPLQPAAAMQVLRPGREAEAGAAPRGGEDVVLETTVYGTDLDRTAGRVVGMTSPEQARSGQGTAQAAGGTVRGPVFLARWTAADRASTRDPVRALSARERDIVTSETAWAGAQRVTLPRSGRDFPVAPAAVAGTLRVFGLDPRGEKQYYHLPMKAVTPGAGVHETTFALDAAGLQDLLGFVARREREAVLQVHDGAVHLADVTGQRSSVLPSVGVDRLPASLRAIAEAAGLPARTADHRLTEPVRRVQAHQAATRVAAGGRGPGATREPERAPQRGAGGIGRTALGVELERGELQAPANDLQESSAPDAARASTVPVAPLGSTSASNPGQETPDQETSGPATSDQNTGTAGGDAAEAPARAVSSLAELGRSPVAVSATRAGVRTLMTADLQRRALDREIAELGALLEVFPVLGSAEVQALRRRAGGIGSALAEVLASPLVARAVDRSSALASVRQLVAMLRDRGLSAPTLADEPLDLFAGSPLTPGTEDEAVERQWATVVSRLRGLRGRLVTRRQDLEARHWGQTTVIGGGLRPEAAAAELAPPPDVEEAAEPDTHLPDLEPARAVVRRRI